MDGVLSTLKCRNDVLRRRLQQCNEFSDEFVLRLDSAQELEILLAYVNSFFYVSSFELGLSLAGLVAFGKLLDEFSGRITGVAEHKSRITLESTENLCLYALLLERLLKQRVLRYQELDVLLEPATKKTVKKSSKAPKAAAKKTIEKKAPAKKTTAKKKTTDKK